MGCSRAENLPAAPPRPHCSRIPAAEIPSVAGIGVESVAPPTPGQVPAHNDGESEIAVVSPRQLDPWTRTELIDIAARLLAEEGPQALSTRRIAAEAGSSTMAVYTHFGSMGGLVRAMVYEGFARLHGYFTRVRSTDDPVADMAVLGRAYRQNAQANSHLYSVMFGAASLGGFLLSEEDRQHGRYTLVGVAACAARCLARGRFTGGDAELIAHQMWSGVHGLVTLELGGYLVDPYGADMLFENRLVTLMIGAGDHPDKAARSVRAARDRTPEEVTPACEQVRLPSRPPARQGTARPG